jgi:hypothetical protein
MPELRRRLRSFKGREEVLARRRGGAEGKRRIMLDFKFWILKNSEGL